MSNEYILSKRKESLYGSAEFNMPSRPLTKEELESGKTSDWYRLQLTGYLRMLPIKICNHTFLTTLVLKNNLFESLPQEICKLENLKNLDASSNNISSLPPQMGYMFQLRNILLSNNRIKELPQTFGFLHNIRMLDLRYNVLANSTKQYYDYESGGKVLIRFLLEQYFLRNKIVAPPSRSWHLIEQPSDGMSFTLMCYNVLCQKYATTAMYPYCPTFALEWEYRKRGILEEIGKYNADIICLQELETSQFENVFAIELKKRNYDSVFVPKSRSRTMHESDSKCVDGCAIFWKVECFEKVDHFTHEFMLSCSSVSKNPAPELLNRVMNRDNVALSIILEVKDPKMAKRRLCVSTGHIHWDPEYSDVKVIQTLFWTSELWNYIREFYKKENSLSTNPDDMPVILCGDFNSLPQSAVIDYLVKGEVERSHVDFRDFGDKYLFEEWTQIQHEFVENDSLKHHFNFDRAYKDENDSGLKWTNYTYDFRGIIDYIFYSKDRLKLLGNLKQIPELWFDQQKIVGAPHVHLNSDHFSLLVELELKNTSAGPSAAASQSSSVSSSSNVVNNINSGTVTQRLNCAATNNNININSNNNNGSSINSSSSSILQATTSTPYQYRGQSTWS